MLSELKVQTILALEYMKRNDHKSFHSGVKLIASDLDIVEAFISMYQSIMTKIEKCASEGWIVLNIVINHSIKILECYYKEKK